MQSVRTRTAVAYGLMASVLIADQIIKFAVKTSMYLGERIDVTSWFQIVFTENKGMAFGMDFIGTFFLAAFRILAVALFLCILHRLIRRAVPMGLVVCWAFVVAGAAGNIIDNCLYGLIFSPSGNALDPMVSHTVAFGNGYGSFLEGRVVDMFYFPLFRWPDWVPLLGCGTFFGAIFNFADAAISCGAIALVLFYRKHLSADNLLPERLQRWWKK